MNDPLLRADLRVVHAGHTVLAPAERAAIEDFIVQPQAPWFSAGEQAFVRRALAGEFAATAEDYFFLLSVGGRFVSHAWFPVSRRNPEIGVLGYVLTDAAHRGRGHAARVGAALLERFREEGGVAMYLGTGNPTAHRGYERQGFKDYNGHVMRWLADPQGEAEFDSGYFAPGGLLSLRPAEWGDLAPATALYTTTATWVARDVTEGIFLPAGGEQLRCVSIYVALMLRSEQLGNRMDVIETAARRVVGCLSQLAGGAGGPDELELMLHPAFAESAAPLLRARLSGAPALVCHAAPEDGVKRGLLRALGFREAPAPVERNGHALIRFQR